MEKKMDLKTNCKTCRAHLADLLLDESYVATRPELAAHLVDCTECRTELAELRSTYALLDSWAAPEPSPYFDVKLHARLREVQAAAPEGLWDRMRSFLMFSTGRGLRPAIVGALALVLVAGGGGTLADLYQHSVTANEPSATVNDLKILDSNAQALQQMDQLLDTSDGGSATPTT